MHSATFHIEVCMVDGKMAGLLQGDTGSACHYCHLTTQEYNVKETITQGFTIYKNWTRCKADYEAKRKGQVHQPIIQNDLRYFGITHTMMRSLDMMLKIYYRLISKEHKWVSKADKEKVLIAKLTSALTVMD